MGPGDSGSQDQGRKLTEELAARAGLPSEPLAVSPGHYPQNDDGLGAE
jgi:hypothetical protein